MKLAAETIALSERLGDKRAIEILAKAGFDYIDYTFSGMHEDNSIWNTDAFLDYASELKKYAEENGISFIQAHAPFVFNWDSEEEQKNKAIPRIRRSIEAACALGVKTIIIHPIHHLIYKGNEEYLYEKNQEFYKTLLPLAEKVDVKIALENMFQPDKDGNPTYDVYAHSEEFVKAIDDLDNSFAVGCVDVGHAALTGEGAANMIRKLGHNRVKALHIHDNKKTIDDHLLPFLGSLNWNDICRALADIEYDGVFTFEILRYYELFEDEFLQDAVCFAERTGRYLIKKIEKCYS